MVEGAKKIKVCQIASADMTMKFMLLGQLKCLLKEGYEVFAVSSPGKWLKALEKEGIKIKAIRFPRKISPFSDILAFFKLYFYFKKEKFDIVHTHTLKPEIYGQIAAKLAGVPIIINTLHGFDFSDEDPLFKKKFILFLQRIAGKCSTAIFAIARDIIERAIQEKIAKPEVFHYLGRDIDTERFNPQRFSQEYIFQKKKELGLEPETKVIGIVARLVGEKGFLELFEAFQGVVSQFPNICLLVVGPQEPEKKDSISPKITKKYQIEDKVVFVGERSDVENFYAIMDIFVLPTHREGLGAAILEASSMEKPVIATNVGGCVEAVDDKKTGFLVPVKNPGRLKAALLYLLKHPQKAALMGREGRKKVLREFNQELIFERLKREYKKFIQKKLNLKKIK